MPGEEGRYKQFTELYGTETNESHRPSLQKKSNKRKTLPFACSLRHVKNVDMMLECEHCGLWRLLYSQKKLSRKEREELEEALADFTFTCGAPLQELQLAGKLAELCERPICVYCACSVPEGSATAEHYPHCFGCSRKPNILK
jgi:ribosomal protein L44E